MNYRISQEGFDKLSRIPALLVSGCEEPQVEEAKALAEAVVSMAQPVERSDTFGPQGPDVSNKTPSALQVEETCQTALHVGAAASRSQPEQEQVQAAIEAGHYSSYVQLEAYHAQRAWDELAWEEAESGELRTHYAYAGGLEYRACLTAEGELEQVQVRADPRLLLATRAELDSANFHRDTLLEGLGRIHDALGINIDDHPENEINRLRAAQAEAEAGREDHANGYQRLWNALWDVRERCERGEGCTANLLTEVINNVQQAELDLSKWPSKALATAQAGEKGGA